jgi:hypothetical protein
MTRLLKHVYTHGPRHPEQSWRRSARNTRKRAWEILQDHPSLHAHLSVLSKRIYPRARRNAHELFPETCPWTPEQVLTAPLDGPNGLFLRK